MAIDTAEEMSSPPKKATDRSGVPAGRWLTVFWPLAILFHLAGNGSHLLNLQAGLNLVGVSQLAVVAAAAAMLVRPGPRLAGGLGGLFVGVLWLKMPVVGNHEIILGLFSLAVIPAVCAWGCEWPQRIAPAGRLILLISYGFIAFSKLNTGFLNTVGSCAVLFADEFGDIIGIRPGESAAISAVVIAATVVIEACIPVMLLTSRFRRHGVGLALGFHFVLALDPASHIWDFSATLLPLFLLFAPVGVHQAIDRRIQAVDRRPLSERSLVVSLVLAVQAVAMAGGLVGLPTWTVAFPLWVLISGTVAAGHVLSLGNAPDQQADRVSGSFFSLGAGPRWLTASMLLIIGVTVLNGVAPYLELRSAAAFNMYSNLRVVDGRSNHLIVGGIRSGDESSYVSLVEVDDGSVLEFYIEGDLALPRENLDRYLIEHPDENPLVADTDGSTPARSLGFGAPKTENGWFHQIRFTILHKLAARRAVHTQGEMPGDEGAVFGTEPKCLRAWGPIG